MKATAVAPANIAFIKYWGRRDAQLRLPHNASISMNLSAAYSTTTVEFSPSLQEDDVTLLDPGGFNLKERDRVVGQLDIIREKAGTNLFARVVTQNSFPKSTGAASSASGFAAVTMAAVAALGLHLSERALTILSRLGSGSACRSIPDGFVKWEAGTTSDESYAHSLYHHDYWDLRDILVIVGTTGKDVSSSAGHDSVETSPNFIQRLHDVPSRMSGVEQALRDKNFIHLGELIEEDCLSMHHVMQTQTPPLMYWNDMTSVIMNAVDSWRKQGIPVYFTIDAGPNVHLICEGNNAERVVTEVKKVSGIRDIIVNKPAEGAHLVTNHLF